MEASSERSSNYASAESRVFNYPPPPSSVSSANYICRNGQRSKICDESSISSSASASLASASSVSSTSSNPTELTCFLCKDIFVEPMILSCGHSFCLKCVEKWLRRCTNCPVCRVATLEPIHNITLSEMLQQYQNIERQANKTSAFQRSVTQPFMRTFGRSKTNKEAKTLQQESIRASRRKPKQLDFRQPKFEHKFSASSHPSMIDQRGYSQQTAQPVDSQDDEQYIKCSLKFQRVSNLRRSFNKFRQKIGSSSNQSCQSSFLEKKESQRDVSRQNPSQSPEESSSSAMVYNACSSASSGYRSLTSPTHNEQDGVLQRNQNELLQSLQVYVLSAVGGGLKYIITQAFVSNVDNVELAEFPEASSIKSPSNKAGDHTDILDSIQRADTTVLIYSVGDVTSFRRLLEFFSHPNVLPACRNMSFLLIALKNNVSESNSDGNSKEKLAKHQGQRLARLLNANLVEVAASELASKVPTLFSPAIALQKDQSISTAKCAVRQRHHLRPSSNSSMMSICEELQHHPIPTKILQNSTISGNQLASKENVVSLPSKKDSSASSQCSLM